MAAIQVQKVMLAVMSNCYNLSGVHLGPLARKIVLVSIDFNKALDLILTASKLLTAILGAITIFKTAARHRKK